MTIFLILDGLFWWDEAASFNFLCSREWRLFKGIPISLFEPTWEMAISVLYIDLRDE